jgi:TATA-box binding protein (TBP) (component of TFIID and TFIIIB)
MSLENKKIKESKVIIKEDGSIKQFNEITVSTKTVIGISNLKIDLDKFFNYIPITDFVPPQKKRGRKRRIQIATSTNLVPYGSIITIQRKKEIRGAILKTKKKKTYDDNNKSIKEDDKDYFLHSVSLVIILENSKEINMKISGNGKLQITGCKSDDHFIQAIVSLYNTMIEVEKWIGEKIFTISGDNLEVVFNTVMQNMDFNVGFRINRYKLDKYINKYTKYCSIFEGSLSTGVNIKVKSDPTVHPKILKIRCLKDGTLERFYTSFEEYKILLDKKKETKREKHHTFLVFASGSIIMSSRGSEMKEVYDSLVDILINNRDEFEDKNFNYEKEKEEDEKYACNTKCCLKEDYEDECSEDEED